MDSPNQYFLYFSLGPQNQIRIAHSDQPLREGHVHISAPHIYGAILEALELEPNSSQSFLNIGSGTGYLSCIVANLLGPRSVHVAIEVSSHTMAHAHESLKQWKTDNPDITIPPIEFIHGNALHIDLQQGEAVTGFDRIYLGAAVPRSKLNRFAQLLRPGGVLVGPGKCS
jgi:protein-L-isoaspartate(D-aspartate) O-methyltransferase